MPRGRDGKALHRRTSSTAAAATSFKPDSNTDGRHDDADATDNGVSVSRDTKAVSTTYTPYLSHLKRRGPFLPALLPKRNSTQAPTDATSSWLGLSQRHGKPMLNAQHYGKWRELVFDYDQLMFESGLIPPSLSSNRTRRSVDRPEHATDIGLWSAIFNFAQRRGDSDGALVVWREIFQRMQLHQVDGVVAQAFWQSVAEAAVDDEAFLESTWAYAEWMHDEHSTLWPSYYRTVVGHFLESEEYEHALHWHVRLSAHFAVPKRGFFDMLKDFLCDPDPELQDALQSIYITSRHRQLYDTIVPLLFSRGCSALARSWRETLIRHDDQPAAGASRPFLQHLAGYYPEVDLSPQEQTIANTRPAQYLPPPSTQTDRKSADMPTNLFHLMNRVHGETFGIHEKAFNDKIGARWFATSWVSADTAINLVYSLGIEEIGPLSLQSIALREGTPAGVMRRLAQLEQCQIGIGQTNYARAIRHLAKVGDAETLHDLLHSTLHPDVFDDIVQQRYVLGSATFTGDWKTHRLLLAVRLAVSQDTLVTASNRLLLACLEQKKKSAVIKLLDEFSARGTELLPATCESVSRSIVADMPRTLKPDTASDVDFYAAMCRRLAALRLPVATEAWRNILTILGRQGRLSDLEKVALDVVDQYVSLQATALPKSSPPATETSSAPSSDAGSAFKVHIADVPDIVRGEGRQEVDLGYRLLPRDIPFNHPLHPLSLVFNQGMTEAIVRWYFHRKSAYRQRRGVRRPNRRAQPSQQPAPQATASGMGSNPHDFALAGGIRLLAMLRDRGVEIPVDSVKSEALVCIAALFGPQSMMTRYWQPARSMNQLTLQEVKELCDAAWVGSGVPAGAKEALLPAVKVIENALEAIKPVASAFGGRISQRGDKKKVSRETFIDAVSDQL